MSGDLVTFLRARLDEDEAIARAAGGDAWHGHSEGIYHEDVRNQPGAFAVGAFEVFTGDEEIHIIRHDPARTLREVAAKRAIVDAFDVADGDSPRDRDRGRWDAMNTAVRHVTAVYRDHPDYRQKWAP